MPEVECVVTASFASPAAACAVLKALAPDNGPFVKAVRKGTVLTFTMRAGSIGSLLQTADDLLRCLQIASEAASTSTSAGRRGRSAIRA